MSITSIIFGLGQSVGINFKPLGYVNETFPHFFPFFFFFSRLRFMDVQWNMVVRWIKFECLIHTSKVVH